MILVMPSAALAYISRASLKAAFFHGFHRSVAWECIPGLVLLNFIESQQRFEDPLFCPAARLPVALDRLHCTPSAGRHTHRRPAKNSRATSLTERRSTSTR